LKIPENELAQIDRKSGSGERKSGSGARKAEDDMAEMRKLIEDKVKKYVPEDQQDESAEFTGTEMISISDLMFKYADRTDMCYYYMGIIASIGFGGALPGFTLFFGEMIDSMG